MRKRTYQIRIEPWSAVKLVTHGDACVRATAMGPRRFLSREAPALPLKGCTRASDCRCIYMHFVDRRSGARRDEPATSPQKASPPLERRGVRDRRGPR
jgi:hypothetical protein